MIREEYKNLLGTIWVERIENNRNAGLFLKWIKRWREHSNIITTIIRKKKSVLKKPSEVSVFSRWKAYYI